MDTQKDFQTLERAIHTIEHKADIGQLNDDEIAKYQHFLDRLADKYQEDDTVGSQKFMLYELQAMIWQARGDNDQAVKFLHEAESVKLPDDHFISHAGREWESQAETATVPKSVITRTSWKPAKLFWVSIAFLILFEILTKLEFGLIFTIIPDVLCLVLFADSIVTKIRDVIRGHRRKGK